MTSRSHISSLKHRLFEKGFSAIVATRANRWLRPLAMGSGIILMFHHVRPWKAKSFAPNRYLEITPDFLVATITMLKQEGFDIVSLDEVPDRLSVQRSRPFAALTFDDGYRDNLEYAWPILRRLDIPWTMFVVKDFADGYGRLWWLELEEAIARLDRIEIKLDGKRCALATGKLAEKYAAFDLIKRRLMLGSEQNLLDVVTELSTRINLDPDSLIRNLCADWSEIALLAEDPNVTIGSHTLSHPILAQYGDTFAASEISGSKYAIEKRLGMKVWHIAFPHGDRNAADLREFALSRESGYATGVTTRPGHIFPEHARQITALPRISINGLFQTEAALRSLLSGVPFMALDLLGVGKVRA
ncbi:polysaccharide deacetylase family protein [Microvirga sp. 2TAF3]|uniref:polysaccharide deacetylase family protein n=1 Tax=Microvirga sp. 2TAF3 TaxID=3233014 RepID=UPI003F95DD32